MAVEAGSRMLAASSYGFRNFTNNVRPIKPAADEGDQARVPKPDVVGDGQCHGWLAYTDTTWEEHYGALQSRRRAGEPARCDPRDSFLQRSAKISDGRQPPVWPQQHHYQRAVLQEHAARTA